MGTRTVRLDDEAEETLQKIRKVTGMSISAALKQGLLALREKLTREESPTAWEVYERLDLGPGGYSIGPSTRTRDAVREAVRKKHRR
jgi:hypothetical protein